VTKPASGSYEIPPTVQESGIMDLSYNQYKMSSFRPP
jgi:hypothetical protein